MVESSLFQKAKDVGNASRLQLHGLGIGTLLR